MKDQFLKDALSRIPIEAHDDTRNLIKTLFDAAVGFQAVVEVSFPGLRELAMDTVSLASILIDSSSFMDQQWDVIAAVANRGHRSTNAPPGKDFYWTLRIRNGLYQPAEDLARAALERCTPTDRAFWELRVQRTSWFRNQLAVIGQRANRMTAEEVAAELAKSNDDAK